jgi:hypothetical protein
LRSSDWFATIKKNVLITICHSVSSGGNPPVKKGETIRGKVARHVNANSKSEHKCYGKNSKTKATTTTVKVKIKKERIMILSFFCEY